MAQSCGIRYTGSLLQGFCKTSSPYFNRRHMEGDVLLQALGVTV